MIINPGGFKRCIEGNIVQGTSRALSEEVAFDRARVTSTDWLTYPILDITEPSRHMRDPHRSHLRRQRRRKTRPTISAGSSVKWMRSWGNRQSRC